MSVLQKARVPRKSDLGEITCTLRRTFLRTARESGHLSDITVRLACSIFTSDHLNATLSRPPPATSARDRSIHDGRQTHAEVRFIYIFSRVGPGITREEDLHSCIMVDRYGDGTGDTRPLQSALVGTARRGCTARLIHDRQQRRHRSRSTTACTASATSENLRQMGLIEHRNGVSVVSEQPAAVTDPNDDARERSFRQHSFYSSGT